MTGGAGREGAVPWRPDGSVISVTGARNGAIWRAYISGRTQGWIADRHGIDQTRVSQILAEVRAALPADALEDWRIRALETLRHFHAEMVDLARGEPALVRGANGEIVGVDHSNRLAAMDRVVRIQERMAKMLGLDAPERVAAITVDTSADVAALLDRARAASAAEEARIRGDWAGQRPAWRQWTIGR